MLYDTKYYRGTDAGAFYEAWGDIVGGIGSYPILANPNYHQPTDYLDTINQHHDRDGQGHRGDVDVPGVEPVTAQGLQATRAGADVTVTWTPSPETGITSYIVAYGPAADPMRTRVNVKTPTATLPNLPAGTHIAVKAVNGRGLEGWDWARTSVQ